MVRTILRVVVLTLVAVLMTAAAFGGGFVVSRQLIPPTLSAEGGAPDDWKPYFPVFWEAWNLVHQDFYKPSIDDNALVNGSVSGMVERPGGPAHGVCRCQTCRHRRCEFAGVV